MTAPFLSELYTLIPDVSRRKNGALVLTRPYESCGLSLLKGEQNSAPGVSLPWEACGSLQWFLENSAAKPKISISTKGIVKAAVKKALMIRLVK